MEYMNVTIQNLQIAATATITAIIILLIREGFARLRDSKEYSIWQIGNLKEQLELNYFGEEISKTRESLKRKLKSNEIILPTDRDAYLLGKSLQQVGALCLLGSVPIRPLLFLNGPQVIEDWLAVKNHVYHIRGQELYEPTVMPFHRRHAEWVALLSVMWMMNQKNFDLPSKHKEIMNKFRKYYFGSDGILKRELFLFYADKEFSPTRLKTERRRIVKKFKYNMCFGFRWLE